MSENSIKSSEFDHKLKPAPYRRSDNRHIPSVITKFDDPKVVELTEIKPWSKLKVHTETET